MILPKEKTPPKSSLSDLSVLVYGRTKIGKCLSGNALLYDPGSCRPLTMEALTSGAEGRVLTLREAGIIAAQQPAAYHANEPAQLYRLTTQTGRSIESTAGHPFLTREGWKPLSELTVSDRVAVVAEYPALWGHGDTDDDLIKILAYLIADGSLASGSSPLFTKNDPEVRLDFEVAVEAKGDECVEFVNEKGITHVRVRGKRGSRNNVIGSLKEVGLRGLRSAEKHVPEFVFGLRRAKLRLFLNRLFSCDGSIEASGRVSYSSTSVRLVHEVQHLLSRFGIVSLVRPRYLKGALYGAELLISSKANVLAFLDEIGVIGEKAARAEAVRSSLYNIRGAETQLDRLGPVLFDRVAKMEPTGIEPVYDVTVEGSQNFIANDFVVHNSTFCSHAEGAVFLATEPGLNHLSTYQVPITSWPDFTSACAEITQGGHSFQTVIIDTIDNAFRLCSDYHCRKLGVAHESDLGFGKGYAIVHGEFHRVLTRLSQLPYGLWLISHAQEREVETRTGKITRIEPTLPGKAKKIVLGLVDLVLFCDVETTPGPNGKPVSRRVIRTKPSARYEAGDRTGRLPEVLPLDYAAFVKAFNEK